MRTLTGEYPYQKFGVGTIDLTFIPFPLMEKTFARLDDELILLLISAHEALGTLEGMVRFAPNASALRTLLLKKDACCSLQIDNKGINVNFYEMMQLTSAEQKRYDTVADTIMVYEAYIKKPFAISILCDIFDEVMHSKTPADFSKLSENQLVVRDLFNVGRDRVEIKERVYAAMRDIAQFFQHEFFVDVFTKIALIHYQFEMLRPFPRLNGVIGRMGTSMLLFEAGFRAADAFAQPKWSLSFFVFGISAVEPSTATSRCRGKVFTVPGRQH